MDMTHKPSPRVKQVWVKKDGTIHPLRGVDSPSKGEVPMPKILVPKS
jgi:hypothetical protein